MCFIEGMIRKLNLRILRIYLVCEICGQCFLLGVELGFIDSCYFSESNFLKYKINHVNLYNFFCKDLN